MSVPSAICRDYIDNGHRYQSLREDGYLQPTNEKEWAVMDNADLPLLILDCQRKEPHFRAEIGEKAQNLLNVGTGDGMSAIEAAENYPNREWTSRIRETRDMGVLTGGEGTVYGVDLYPPPQSWLPPNCILEVDDMPKVNIRRAFPYFYHSC